MKIFKLIFALIAVILLVSGAFVAGLGAGLYYALSPAGGGKTAEVKIEKGEPAAAVAKKLEKAGVIKNSLLFRLAIKLTKSGSEIKPGTYKLSSDKNVIEIIEKLKEGTFRARMVTIPEGLTVAQIAELLDKNNIVTKEEFLKAVNNAKPVINGQKIENLEGYLFPDTYDFPDDVKAEEVVKIMLDNFDKKIVPYYKENKDKTPLKLNLKEVMTLASIIEREAKVPAERPVIAMVYYNRLKKGMKLECDATIQYALGEQKEVLTYNDLKINSPYNTYQHIGLPPAPISNPGEASVKAALIPKKVGYLFYVRNDVKNDGSHVFSANFKQHQDAIKKYQK